MNVRPAGDRDVCVAFSLRALLLPTPALKSATFPLLSRKLYVPVLLTVPVHVRFGLVLLPSYSVHVKVNRTWFAGSRDTVTFPSVKLVVAVPDCAPVAVTEY